MDKYQRLLLGLAIGDAFGAGYENFDRKTVKEKFDFTKYDKHPKTGWNHIAGQYTDDTQMSIAIAELLILGKVISEESLADYFVEAYKRDARAGYSKRIQEALEASAGGGDFLRNVNAESNGNGAAMRATPLGALESIEEVINAALINAKVTHDTDNGRMSSACMAAASHYLLNNLGPEEKIFNFCIDYCGRIYPKAADYLIGVSEMRHLNPIILFGEESKDFGVPMDGVKTVGAVLYLLSNAANAKEILESAVLLGGDVDSVAALATGLKAINHGLDSLPDFLFSELENGPYGRDYILGLGARFAGDLGSNV